MCVYVSAMVEDLFVSDAAVQQQCSCEAVGGQLVAAIGMIIAFRIE